MSNKKSKLGVISAVAAGTGTAIYLAQKAKKESGNSIFKKSTVADSSVPDNYRNTERGKYDRNSKGIYYSNGNYEAFARPEKPDGVDEKNDASPIFTHVMQGEGEIGRTAVRYLIDRIRGREVPERTYIPYDIVRGK